MQEYPVRATVVVSKAESDDKDGKPAKAIDSAGLYMSDMAKIPILEPDQEIEAFRRVAKSEEDLVRHLLSPNRFAKTAIRDLCRAFAEDGTESVSPDALQNPRDHANEITQRVRSSEPGREWFNRTREASITIRDPAWIREFRKLDRIQRNAKEFCILSNLRLVISIARKYVNGHPDLSFNDLIQEGNVGLIKAVDRFDVGRGCRFGTYATWWIRHFVKRAIQDKGKLVRIPVHVLDNIALLTRTEASFMTTHGREPTQEELSEATKFPTKKVRQLQEYKHRSVLSIDAPVVVDLGNEMNHQDIMADESVVLAEDEVHLKQTEGFISKMLTALTPQESQILRWRFGFSGQEPRTLAEIGETMSLSRERIRQIEVQAIQKLRKNGEINQYR